MKLKSLNRYISFFILLFSFLPIYAEEEIDIWNKDKKKNLEVINKEKIGPLLPAANDKNKKNSISNRLVYGWVPVLPMGSSIS